VTIQQLLIFDSLVKTKNYSRSEEILYISQSNLRRMMKALEKELNVKLFTKKNQEMVLSDAGIHFYKYAKAILTSCSELEDKVKELRTTPGESLIVATTSSIAESFMPELMHIFHKRKDMKDTEVILKLAPSSDAVLDMLKNGEVELAFLYEYDTALNYDVCAYHEYMMVLPSTHPLASKERIKVQDIIGEPFIFYEKNSSCYHALKKIFSFEDVEPNIIRYANTSEEIITYASWYNAIGIIPKANALGNDVVFRSIDSDANRFPIYMCWPDEKSMTYNADYMLNLCTVYKNELTDHLKNIL
jgi:DNA-binding transcriptional LysR family regulator